MDNHETKPSYEKKEVNEKIKLIDIMSRGKGWNGPINGRYIKNFDKRLS